MEKDDADQHKDLPAEGAAVEEAQVAVEEPLDDDDERINPEDIDQIVEVDDTAPPEDEDYGDIEDDVEEVTGDDNEPGEASEEAMMDPDDDGDVYPDRGNNAKLQVEIHNGPVFSVVISPDGKLAATGDGDDKAFVWDLATGEVVFELTGHEDSVTALAFSSSGEYLASGDMEGEIRIWSVEKQELVTELSCADDLTFLSWHPKAKFLIAGTASGPVHMWSVPSGTLSYFAGHTEPVSVGVWAPDGRTFGTVSDDGSCIVWSPKTQQAIAKVDGTAQRDFHQAPVTCLAWLGGAKALVTGAQDGTARIVNVATGKVILALADAGDGVESVAVSNSQPSKISVASLDGTLRVFDASTGQLNATCQHEQGVVKTIWHEENPIVYSASLDGSVKVWDGRSGECKHELYGHRNHVLDFTVSKDGRTVITTGQDKRVFVFEIDV